MKLPISLSPHICILPSPDLEELLAASSLPSLPHILQSFSPIPDVTTRTTSLTNITHKTFSLRFSDLAEIEEACRENESERAVRAIDWMSSRIARRCAKWVEEMQKVDETEVTRIPWWEELKRCTEGDHVPSRFECWNHPIAVILAVSTMTANPLQALTALHARALDFPPWVDSAILKYTLVIHSKRSSLTDEEAVALFNAVKKQYGLDSYLLSLSLPTPPPPPVTVLPRLPRLPPLSSLGSPELTHATPSSPERANLRSPNPAATTETGHNTLRLGQDDIQATAKFTKEFLCKSILLWMEKCVIDWNENFSASRRLPSRLFSSTRRLFGSPSPSPAPTTVSTPARSNTHNGVLTSTAAGVANFNRIGQQRRLAEFATILGDIKVALNVWDSLAKESNTGAEVLPMLKSPTPSIPAHVSVALSSINPSSSEPPAHSLLRALSYAVRWESVISPQDFISNAISGEQWLVWAAGNAEESPSALLLAHAALLSARKQLRRKAALWYLFAANRLEKCGIKPLTMYFLRRALELYKLKPVKSLSPSFWDSEGLEAAEQGLDAIISGIEHPLGRLLYTTGDVAAAVRLFLGLLRGSSMLYPTSQPEVNGDAEPKTPSPDGIFVEDFRIALTHFKTSMKSQEELSDLRLPFTFCLERQIRIRFPSDHINGGSAEWEKREETWKSFWRQHGQEGLRRSGKAIVNETFWVDLAVRNPLDTDVNLSNLTVVMRESNSSDSESVQQFLDIETVDDVVLGARETRMIPISIKSKRTAVLVITHVKYDFLSVLSSTESLSSEDTKPKSSVPLSQGAGNRPVTLTIEVEEASHRLLADFVDDSQLVLAEGEVKELRIWVSNAGTNSIHDLWIVTGPDDEVWLDIDDKSRIHNRTTASTEIYNSHNSLVLRKPYRIDLTAIHGSSNLEPGACIVLSLFLHTDVMSQQDLLLLVVSRENDGDVFHATRVMRSYEVRPVLAVSASAEPSASLEQFFTFNLELRNLLPFDSINVLQLTTLSPSWKCTSAAKRSPAPIAPNQSMCISLGVTDWHDRDDPRESMAFVSNQLRSLLNSSVPINSNPPPVNLVCNHISHDFPNQTIQDPRTRHFIHGGRRKITSRSLANSHPHILPTYHPFIFPLYHPFAVDVVVFWDIPSQRRSGHILLTDITLGANHAILRNIIDEAENAKAKRSMYAETRREKGALLEDIRCSEWNAEMDPIVVTLQDGATFRHDFTKGSFCTQVQFTLRNYSLTHPSRYILKLTSTSENQSQPSSSNLLQPRYSGRLTFRGTIQPTDVVTLQPTMWISRPGSYSLGGWCLETEVGECGTNDSTEWRTRHRYVQSSPLGDPSCITVCDSNPNTD